MLTTLENYIRDYPILASIISGFVSSGIFLFTLSLFKPSIGICKSIAYDTKNKKYLLKIINKSLFYKIYDVTVRLHSIEIVQTLNGENFKVEPIRFKLNTIKSVSRLNYKHLWQDLFHGENRLKGRTDYAAVFSTETDLKNLLIQKKSIRFEVYARHTLTGFAKIFTYDYKHSGNIIDGTFLSGNSCIIKNC